MYDGINLYVKCQKIFWNIGQLWINLKFKIINFLFIDNYWSLV